MLIDNACKAATKCWELAEIKPENIDPVLFRAVTCMIAEYMERADQSNINCEFYKDQVTLCENYMDGLKERLTL